MRTHARALHLVSLAACLLSQAPLGAQPAGALSADVKRFVRIGTPRVVLEHVLVIDGTGAAPQRDRNVTLADGRIAEISDGADVPPSEGTTVLDLRGRAVLPGIVGMHEHL